MSRPAPFSRRKLVLGTPVVLAGGLLAACASDPEPPPAPPTGEVDPEQSAPVATVDLFETLVTEIHEAVVTADEEHDAELLAPRRSEEHTSELQSRGHLVCRLLLEKKQYKCNY